MRRASSGTFHFGHVSGFRMHRQALGVLSSLPLGGRHLLLIESIQTALRQTHILARLTGTLIWRAAIFSGRGVGQLLQSLKGGGASFQLGIFFTDRPAPKGEKGAMALA